MIRQIRSNVFETNSSSTHSMVITTKDEMIKWINGDYYYIEDVWMMPEEIDYEFKEGTFIPTEKVHELFDGMFETSGYDEFDTYMKDEFCVCTYDNWQDYLEHHNTEYTSPSGDVICIEFAFGYDG